MKLASVVFASLISAIAAAPLPDGLYAEVTTPRGQVTAELFHRQAPLTVANYVGLAEGVLGPAGDGKPFFDGLSFHRVVADFVVQGGDPTGTGSGDAGYKFPDEITPELLHRGPGVVQMANDGPDTNGSQWCFILRPSPHLDYLHSVFGQVVEGLEILPRIEQGDVMKVKILRVGKDAEAFRVTRESFATMVAKAKRYTGPLQPGPDAPFDDPDKLLPTDWPRAQAVTCKLANFERFTGRRVAARVLAKIPAGEGGIGRYLTDTAERLKLGPAGVLAVYCADEDRWHLIIGPEVAGIPADQRAETETRLLTQARKLQEEMTAASLKRLPPGQIELAPSARVRLAVDAMLDRLLAGLAAPRKS
ncbi:MAG: peptidylprolyl isomerase [Verrucomicrobiota bacterium]